LKRRAGKPCFHNCVSGGWAILEKWNGRPVSECPDAYPPNIHVIKLEYGPPGDQWDEPYCSCDVDWDPSQTYQFRIEWD